MKCANCNKKLGFIWGISDLWGNCFCSKNCKNNFKQKNKDEDKEEFKNNNIVKKEELILFLNKPIKGNLILTTDELYFITKGQWNQKGGEKLFNISITKILNVKAEKEIGVDIFKIFYRDNGEEKKLLFKHYANPFKTIIWFNTNVAFSKLGSLYFVSWEKIIEEVKMAKFNKKNNSYNDLEKLSQLKDKGIITEDEFTIKKKQILNIN